MTNDATDTDKTPETSTNETAQDAPPTDAENRHVHDPTQRVEVQPKATRPQEIVEQLRGSFKQLRSVDLVWVGSNRCLAIGVCADDTASEQRIAVADGMVEQFADAGLTAYPLIYAERQWNAISGAADRQQILDLFDEHRGPGRLIGLFSSGRPFPRDTRKLLLRSLRGQRNVFDFVRQSAPAPLHLMLSLAAEAMAEALALLFATEDFVFAGDAESVQVFAKKLAAKADFDCNGVTLYFRLIGLARQHRHAFNLTLEEALPNEDGSQAPWMDTLRAADRFLSQAERHVRRRYTSEREQKRARKLRQLAAVAGGVLLVLLGIWYVISTRPASPISDTSLITKPGAITGEYFAGTRFNRKVLTRSDSDIRFGGTGSPGPGVPVDRFSIRWRGYVFFPDEGNYRLCTKMDDGARLYFNEERLINEWRNGGARVRCGTVHVYKGWYPLVLEYYDQRSRAVIELSRGRDQGRTHPVPPNHLCCGQ